MLNFFKKRKHKKLIDKTEKLMNAVLNILPQEFEYIRENHKKWELSDIFFNNFKDGYKGISLLLRTKKADKFSKFQKRFKNFNISGIEILDLNNYKYEIEIWTYKDNLNGLHFSGENTNILNLNEKSMKVDKLKFLEVETANPDKEILLKILKGTTKSQLERLDIEETIEIEIGNKKYYTIVDYEDGNYIAITKQKDVYRLKHDDLETEKLIYDKVSDFLNEFSGKKNELEHYFE